VYDITITGLDDPYIKVVEETIQIIEDSVVPGRYLVEFLPQRECIVRNAYNDLHSILWM
jgi:hypothetical protein